jgi:hypothetical protein
MRSRGMILMGRDTATRGYKAEQPMRHGRIRAGVRAPRQLAKRAVRSSLYGRWPAPAPLIDGYTLVLPVPGDLPVFLELALAGLVTQEPAGRVEILVVPDGVTPEFLETYEHATARFDRGPIRLVEMGRRGKALQRTKNGPWSKASSHLNHFLQIYHGAAATRTTHAILHDADLFLTDPCFLVERFRACTEGRFACLGVERRFDDWYELNGLGPVLATWELVFDVRWLRGFPPWQISGHSGRLGDVEKKFDTMDYIQLGTPAERRALREAPSGYVHFNWAITHYRLFQESADGPFTDGHFLILLTRLLTDAFGQTDGSHQLPSINELVRGIGDNQARVNYCGEGIEERYAKFRRQITRVIEGPAVDAAQATGIEHSLSPFDVAFRSGHRPEPALT